MKILTTLVVFVFLAAACGSDASVPGSETDGPGPGSAMAVALEELITKDHTFGDGPPLFTDYLVQSDLVDDGRALTDEERVVIENAVGAFGTVQWIGDADDYITDGLRPTVEGGVILGLGESEIDGDSALVPVSLWCGGLCGTWLTYELELSEGAWVVTGIDGPVVIS